MKKRYLSLIIFGLVGMGLFLYNYWSYSCGRCNAESLLTLSLPAKILVGINLLALAVLFLIRFRSRKRPDPDLCACGQRLHSSWLFCPCCGQVKPEKA